MYDTGARTAPDEVTTTLKGIPAAEIRGELEQILRSRTFIQSHRIRRFLQFVVEESLLGQPHRLKEYLIGLEVFDRREAFDPRVDSIVRVEARRLRNKLEEYYRTEGRDDLVRILLRKGSYVPIFEHRSAPSAGAGYAPGQKHTIEVAPFTLVNPGPNDATLADEIQRRLAHVLIKEGGFQVITRHPPNPESPSPAGNGHSTHKVSYIVEGSLELHDDSFHLLLQLQHPIDGSYVWSDVADGRLHEMSAVEQLAQSLIRELATSASEGVVARRQGAGKESRDFYLQGRYEWKLATPDSIRDSVSFFTKAVEADDNYAASWAALAESLLVSSMFGFLSPGETSTQMKDAALKATSLNAMLPEAHVALGSILSILDWDWAAGEQELQKAIQLDSHDPTGHVAHGIHLACRGMLDQAVAEVERALELDPAALFPNFVLGWLYSVCHRFDESIAQHSLISQLAPDYALPHFGLGLAFAGKGRYADAIAHFTNASQMKCRSLLCGQLGYCYAMAGRRDEALKEISILNMRAETQYVSPVSFAAIHSGLGDKEQALTFLERAVEARETSLPVHLLNPEFESLRDEPRFQALKQKIGVAPA